MLRVRIAFWFAYGMAFWVAILGGLWRNAGMIVLGAISEGLSSIIYLNVRRVK